MSGWGSARREKERRKFKGKDDEWVGTRQEDREKTKRRQEEGRRKKCKKGRFEARMRS